MKLADLARALGADLLPPAPSLREPRDAPDSPTANQPEVLGASDSQPSDWSGLRAGHVGGTEIHGVSGIEDAGPDQITFVANPKYAPLARTSRAAAILVEPEFGLLPVATLRVANPYYAFARALALFYQAPVYAPGRHPSAIVDPSAQIGEGVHLGPYVVVGAGVVLGAHSVVLAHAVLYEGSRIGTHFFAHAHAVVREHCVVGDHVTLGNGAVIGSDGFGFARLTGSEAEATGGWYKIPQTGPAVLEDHVEVQALAAVDRASVGETRIGRGAKLDNLVQVGHGSTVGAGTLLCAQVGLAGSTHVGRNVILAGQVGVAGHCTIGDGAIATAQSGIPNDVAPGAVVSGYPAMPNRQWLRASASFQRLPELLHKLRKTSKNEPA